MFLLNSGLISNCEQTIPALVSAIVADLIFSIEGSILVAFLSLVSSVKKDAAESISAVN